MVSTAIRTTSIKDNFEYISETSYFVGGSSIPSDPKLFTEDTLNYLDLRSDKPKLVFLLHSGMFHFWYDSVGFLLRHLEKHPETELVLDYSSLKLNKKWYPDGNDISFYNFFLKILNDKKIKYIEVCGRHNRGIIVNNFYYLKTMYRVSDSSNIIYSETRKYVEETKVKPFRTVYLSRSALSDRSMEQQDINLGTKFRHDLRIDNEKKLEDFLSSIGVEIVSPENFKDFQEQVSYFDTVKTAISLTSSGLTNAIFMRPGSNVIEIVTPLLISTFQDEDSKMWDAEEALHHIYELISFEKRHKHIGITNDNRKAQEVIDYMIEHNFKGILEAL
jgi:hypothetical protein